MSKVSKDFTETVGKVESLVPKFIFSLTPGLMGPLGEALSTLDYAAWLLA